MVGLHRKEAEFRVFALADANCVAALRGRNCGTRVQGLAEPQCCARFGVLLGATACDSMIIRETS
jgi:hypothetical protein